MGWEKTGFKFRKATGLKVGESMVAYVKGFYNGGTNPEIDQLVCVDPETMEEYVLSVAGNLSYFRKNGNKPGYLYMFRRLEDKVNSKKQRVTQYEILVDKTKTCGVSPDVGTKAMTETAASEPVAQAKTTTEENMDRIPF